MVIAVLPVPPMPLMASRRLIDEHGTTDAEHTVCSSFDLLAHLMNLAARKRDDALNKARLARQRQAEQRLLQAVDALPSEPTDPSTAWPIFCTFTREYIQSYLGSSTEQDLRFLPYDSIHQEHKLYTEALDHSKGHDLLFGPMADTSPTTSYCGIVTKAAQRIWRSGRIT